MILSRTLPTAFALLGLTGAFFLTPRPTATHTAAPAADAVTPGADLALIALSGARGILSEILWYQVGELQRERRHIEIVPLSEWITRLDPRAGGAWRYHAWNLAFNVSVMLPEEERWPWVQRGISILKESILHWNPGDPGICNELSWFYSFKIGGRYDDANTLYKLSLARLAAPHLAPGGRRTPAANPWFTTQGFNIAALDALETACGPLDWRIPESYALYWSTEAERLAALRARPGKSSHEAAEARRSILYLLTTLAERGTFAGDLKKGTWVVTPNPAFAQPILARLPHYLQAHGPEDTATILTRLTSIANAFHRPDLARRLESARAALPQP